MHRLFLQLKHSRSVFKKKKYYFERNLQYSYLNNRFESKAAAEFWQKYPEHMPVDRHRTRKWHASLRRNAQINVIGSHRKGKRLSGPPLNQRVLFPIFLPIPPLYLISS